LAMCQAAVAGDPLFTVETIEVNRPGPSFTLDTARQLRLQGWTEVDWLIGADMALTLPSWHQAVPLLSEVNFLIMARLGSTLDLRALPIPFHGLASHIVAAPEIDISSSEIRRRIMAAQSIEYLTPPAVARYIKDHGLYTLGK